MEKYNPQRDAARARLLFLLAHLLAFTGWSLLTFTGLVAVWHANDWPEPSTFGKLALVVGAVVFVEFCAHVTAPLQS